MMNMLAKTELNTAEGSDTAIAQRSAHKVATVTVATQTFDPHPTPPRTIREIVDMIYRTGRVAPDPVVDVREEIHAVAGIQKANSRSGVIDVPVNNASLLSIALTEKAPPLSVLFRSAVDCPSTTWLRKVV